LWILKRVKRRYLALKLEVDGVVSEKDVMDAFWGSVSRLYGEVGASLSGLLLISFDVSCGVVVVRVSLEALSFVRSSLACVTCVGGRSACVHVLAISGTIKALFRRF
jgi:RNase P/RNase MRP subunit POP5